MNAVRLTVDSWDPSYLAPGPEPLDAAGPQVLLDAETPLARWRARPAVLPDASAEVVVVDGVRRVEARVWAQLDDGQVIAGLCASWAAGAARCGPAGASVVAARVARGLVAAAPRTLPDLVTSAGAFRFEPARSAGLEEASIVVQDRMTDLEVEVSSDAVALAAPGALVVLDGPLRERRHLPGAIGLVKTHRVAYLDGEAARVLAGLGPGERTPVFTIVGRAPRHSWYLRLPGPPGGPLAGVVRCECPGVLAPAEAVALAERSAAVLPRLASLPHKDPRAPQNLTPIAGLERHLRHRLGDAGLVLRALRRAAAAGVDGQRGLSPLR